MFETVTLTAEAQLRKDMVLLSLDHLPKGSPVGKVTAYATALVDYIEQNDKQAGGEKKVNTESMDYRFSAEGPSDAESDTVNQDPRGFFRSELRQLLNQHSMDAKFETPDWILADYLDRQLFTLYEFQHERKQWYYKGRNISGATPRLI